MKNIVMRIGFLAALFCVFTSFSLGAQPDTSSPQGNSGKCEDGKLLLMKYAIIFKDEMHKFIDAMDAAIDDKMENHILHVEVPKLKVESEGDYKKLVLLYRTSMDNIVDEVLGKLPVLGTIIKTDLEYEKKKKEREKEQKEIAEKYENIKAKNEVIDILAFLSDEIIEKKKRIDFDKILMNLTNQFEATNLSCEEFFKLLDEEINSLRNNFPHEEEFELNAYQDLIQMMYSISKSKKGFINVLIDHTNKSSIESWNTAKFEHKDFGLYNVEIFLQTGNQKLDEKIEKKLNELISSQHIRHNSVLELEKIPIVVTTLFDYYGTRRGANFIFLDGKILNRWEKSGLMAFMDRTRIRNFLAVYNKDIEPEFIDIKPEYKRNIVVEADQRNLKGIPYGKLVIGSFQFLYKNKDHYSIFKSYLF